MDGADRPPVGGEHGVPHREERPVHQARDVEEQARRHAGAYAPRSKGSVLVRSASAGPVGNVRPGMGGIGPPSGPQWADVPEGAMVLPSSYDVRDPASGSFASPLPPREGRAWCGRGRVRAGVGAHRDGDHRGADVLRVMLGPVRRGPGGVPVVSESRSSPPARRAGGRFGSPVRRPLERGILGVCRTSTERSLGRRSGSSNPTTGCSESRSPQGGRVGRGAARDDRPPAPTEHPSTAALRGQSAPWPSSDRDHRSETHPTFERTLTERELYSRALRATSSSSSVPSPASPRRDRTHVAPEG